MSGQDTSGSANIRPVIVGEMSTSRSGSNTPAGALKSRRLATVTIVVLAPMHTRQRHRCREREQRLSPQQPYAEPQVAAQIVQQAEPARVAAALGHRRYAHHLAHRRVRAPRARSTPRRAPARCARRDTRAAHRQAPAPRARAATPIEAAAVRFETSAYREPSPVSEARGSNSVPYAPVHRAPGTSGFRVDLAFRYR